MCSIFAFSRPDQARAAQTELPSSAFLKTDGKILRDNHGTGNQVVLRGTNAGSWLVQESWMGATNAPDQKTMINTLTSRFGQAKALELIKAYEDAWWTEQDFDNVKALGMNTIRLPFGHFEMLNEDGTLRPTAFDRMDWFVSESAKRGLYVILDMHAAPGSQNGMDHSGDITYPKVGNMFKNEANMAKTVYLWEQIAARYKGNATIATYDLLNEPGGALGKEQWDFYDRLYKAIRAVDPDHTITIEAIWEPYHLPSPTLYGWENMIYSYHFYGWNNTGSSIEQKKFIDSKVPMVNEQTNYNVPLFVGEFSLFSNLQSWEYALNLFEEQGWMWTTWSYKTVNQGSWGLYNGNPSKVNIYNDSYETILSKWSNVDTNRNFSKNHYYADTIGSFADPVKRSASARKWYQKFDGDTVVSAGANATAVLDSVKKLGEGKSVKLTVTGNATPTGTQQYVSIRPEGGDTFDARFAKYLVINGYNETATTKPVYVTLVDKNGNLSSTVQTQANTTLLSNQWSKTALLLSSLGGNADLSAIKEVRLALGSAGTYYFDNLFFGQSFSDSDPGPADTTPGTILSGTEEAVPGQEFDLTYGLKNINQPALAQDVTVTYDPQSLEYVEASPAKDGATIVGKKESSGQVRLILANIGADHGANGDWLKLKFRAKSTPSASTAVSVSEVVYADALGVETKLSGTTHNIKIKAVDKTALSSLIADAKSKHDAAVVGTRPGEYPAEAKTAFAAAIEAAVAVLNNPAATQADVSKAVTDLNAAIQTFIASVVKSIPGDTTGDGTVSIGDLGIVAAAYGKTSADPDWDRYKLADVNNDGKVDITDLAIVARAILE
ncbi:cellulase family glycosylhydrolase [Paenibacillus filicis]|uniref:cellulase n=1 Tax=Paenibacillus filicis TaxID=669464 RepID=A0ABU9DEH5_9BACL